VDSVLSDSRKLKNKTKKKLICPMKNSGKVATVDAVLVFNDVNGRNVKEENDTDWIHTRIREDERYAVFYNRRSAAADSAAQKPTKLDRRDTYVER
jgi:hypothetical protein